jgi:hypothetical protein
VGAAHSRVVAFAEIAEKRGKSAQRSRELHPGFLMLPSRAQRRPAAYPPIRILRILSMLSDRAGWLFGTLNLDRFDADKYVYRGAGWQRLGRANGTGATGHSDPTRHGYSPGHRRTRDMAYAIDRDFEMP